MSTTKVMMKTQKGWQGYWIVNEDGDCVVKTCSACKKELPASSFCRSKSLKYNLDPECKDCKRGRAVKYRQTVTASGKTNLQLVLERSAQRYKNRTDEEVAKDRNRLRPSGEKECNTCKITRSLKDFGVNRRVADGLNTQCRDCIKARNSKVDPNVSKERSTKYRKINANRGPEEVLVDRNRIHPDGVKKCTYCRVRLPLTHFYNNIVTNSGLDPICKKCRDVKESRKRQKKDKKYWGSKAIPIECYVCGAPWVIGHPSDHVIPKSLEGSDESYNRLPLCPTHNGSKWMIPLEIWLRDTMPEKMDEILDRVSGYGVDYKVPEGVYDGAHVFTDSEGQLQWERLND